MKHWFMKRRAAGRILALALFMVAATALFLPEVAYAQACTGVPIASGRIALRGGANFTDGAIGYGGELTAMGGPVSAGIGYRLRVRGADVDDGQREDLEREHAGIEVQDEQ